MPSPAVLCMQTCNGLVVWSSECQAVHPYDRMTDDRTCVRAVVCITSRPCVRTYVLLMSVCTYDHMTDDQSSVCTVVCTTSCTYDHTTMPVCVHAVLCAHADVRTCGHVYMRMIGCMYDHTNCQSTITTIRHPHVHSTYPPVVRMTVQPYNRTFGRTHDIPPVVRSYGHQEDRFFRRLPFR